MGNLNLSDYWNAWVSTDEIITNIYDEDVKGESNANL